MLVQSIIVAACIVARHRSAQTYAIPVTGSSEGLSMSPCREAANAAQRWTFHADGTMSTSTPLAKGAATLPVANRCVAYGGDGVPLILTQCNASNLSQQWAWDGAAGVVRLNTAAQSICFNVRTMPGGGASPGAVGGSASLLWAYNSFIHPLKLVLAHLLVVLPWV